MCVFAQRLFLQKRTFCTPVFSRYTMFSYFE